MRIVHPTDDDDAIVGEERSRQTFPAGRESARASRVSASFREVGALAWREP